MELLVARTLLDVEGQGQVAEPVLPSRLVIDLHVVVEGLLVAQVIVVFHMIVSNHMVRCLLLLLVICWGDPRCGGRPWLNEHVRLRGTYVFLDCKCVVARVGDSHVLRGSENCCGNTLSLGRRRKQGLSRGVAVSVG